MTTKETQIIPDYEEKRGLFWYAPEVGLALVKLPEMDSRSIYDISEAMTFLVLNIIF